MQKRGQQYLLNISQLRSPEIVFPGDRDFDVSLRGIFSR